MVHVIAHSRGARVKWRALMKAVKRETRRARATAMDRSSAEHRMMTRAPEVRWLERGDGPSVVLLHDLLRHMHDWDDVLDRLSVTVRAIAPEFPLFDPALQSLSIGGLARWLDTTLDALAVEQAVLVGHGLGGYVALEFALASPTRTIALMLTGLGSDDERGANPDRVVQPRLRALARAMARYSVGGATARLSVPTLLVFGGRDHMVFPDRAARRAAHHDPSIAVVPDWGQTPMVEQPDAFAAVTRAWIARAALVRRSLRVG